VTQLVLPLHAAADSAAIESTTEPFHSAVEPLYPATDPIAAGAAPTETSCLCVRV
jgi:hypothetical protein